METKLLDGKVLKWSLPVIQGAPGPEAPILKRLLLPQGELAQCFDAEDAGIRYLAYTELRAGCTRGNHYHKVKEEYMYVIRGEMLLVVEDLASKLRESVSLRTGEMSLVSPGIAHAYQTLEAGQAMEFSRTRFNAADVYRFPLV